MHANVTKCPVKFKRKSFFLKLEFAFVLVPFLAWLWGYCVCLFEEQDKTTLYDLYCPYFSPEVMLKLTKRISGHFVTLAQLD